MPQRSDDFERGIAHVSARRFLRARRLLARVAQAGGAEAAWACQEWLQTYLRRQEAEAAEPALLELLPEESGLRLHALGYLYRRTGRPAEARDCFERALAREDAPMASRSELGWMRCKEGREDEGLALLREAEARFEENGDTWGLAISLTFQATWARECFRLSEALELLERARQAKESCGDLLGLATTHYAQAEVFFLRADFLRARRFFETALSIQDQIGFHLGAAATLNNLGSCHVELSEHERASDALRQALRRLDRAKLPGYERFRVAMLTNLGKASASAGRLAVALRHHQAAAALATSGIPDRDAQAQAISNMAAVHRSRGRPERSLELVQSFPRDGLGDRAALNLSQDEASSLMALGRPEEAIAVLEAALRITDSPTDARSPGVPMQLRARALLGRALMTAGRTEASLEVLEAADAAVRRLCEEQPVRRLRLGLMDQLREVGDALVEARHASGAGGVDGAWRTAAALKARELHDVVSGCDVGGQETTDRRQDLEAALRQLGSRPLLTASDLEKISELRREYERLDDGLGGDDRRRRSRQEVEASPAETCASLGPDAALLEYHVSEGDTLVFLIHEGVVESVSLGMSARRLTRSIAHVVAPLRDAMLSADLLSSLHAFDLSASHRLFRELLAPALELLPAGISRLVVVPDGPLHALPFDALVTDMPHAPTPSEDPLEVFRRARFVVDQWSLSYAQSSMSLAAGRRVARSTLATFIAFSPPEAVRVQVAEGERWLPPLPAAESEVAILAGLHGNARRLVGDRATTRACLDAIDTDGLVHVAAHGWSDPRLPSLAGVLVSGDEAKSVDYLTAAKIASHSCSARLVILSACDTAVGRTWQREGVLGLSRAFLEAGAGAVLATLWPVDDEATHDLMVEIHRQLIDEATPADALAHARRIFRNSGPVQRAHPLAWSAFMLTEHAASTWASREPASPRG